MRVLGGSGAPRRTLVVLGLVLALAALQVAPAVAPTAGAQDGFVLGSGAASSTVVKARLFYAGYAIQVPLGLSATSYENRQSRALGGAYDLSAVLGLVKAEVPGLAPIAVSSNAGDAAQGVDLGAGPLLGRVDLTARTVPASTSEVRLADVDLPGILRVEGGHSRSSSSIVDGTERRATAAVDVARISLLGGLVSLDGLHWEATQRSGSAEQADGAFRVATLSLAGVPIAADLLDIRPVLDLLNALLAPLGVVLDSPEVLHRENGSVEVTPLRVGLINSPLGAQALAPVLAGLRPLLVPLYEGLTNIDTTLGIAALVADLGLGVLDGSGGVELAIGGATAITTDTVFTDPLTGLPPELPPAGAPIDAGPAEPVQLPTIGGLPAPVEALPESRIVPAVSGGPSRCVLEASPRRQGSCRGSNVAGAVAVVAVVGAAIAAYDVHVRRRRITTAASGRSGA